MTIMNLTDEDAETAVFLALGAASVCWEDLSRTGVFQSERCERIGQELIDHLRRLRLMPDACTFVSPSGDDGYCACVLPAHPETPNRHKCIHGWLE